MCLSLRLVMLLVVGGLCAALVGAQGADMSVWQQEWQAYTASPALHPALRQARVVLPADGKVATDATLPLVDAGGQRIGMLQLFMGHVRHFRLEGVKLVPSTLTMAQAKEIAAGVVLRLFPPLPAEEWIAEPPQLVRTTAYGTFHFTYTYRDVIVRSLSITLDSQGMVIELLRGHEYYWFTTDDMSRAIPLIPPLADVEEQVRGALRAQKIAGDLGVELMRRGVCYREGHPIVDWLAKFTVTADDGQQRVGTVHVAEANGLITRPIQWVVRRTPPSAGQQGMAPMAGAQ